MMMMDDRDTRLNAYPDHNDAFANDTGAFRAIPSSRALAWRLFLDVLTTALPLEHWPDAIQAKRDQYTDLKNQLYPDFEKVD